MLIRNNLYLSNCDSVYRRSKEDIKSRIIWGLAFAEKIIITPNMIIDNNGIDDVFNSGKIYKYLKNNGVERIILRHNHSSEELCLSDYFKNLHGDYFLSSIQKSKKSLNGAERSEIERRVDAMDKLFLREFNCVHERHIVGPKDLSSKIFALLNSYAENHGNSKDNSGKIIPHKVIESLLGSDDMKSRSEWYNYANNTARDPVLSEIIKYEILDPAYNDVLTKHKESFVLDRLPSGTKLASGILLGGIAYRKEISTVIKLLKTLNYVHTLANDGVISWFIEMAEEDVAEFFMDHVVESLRATKTWENMHQKLAKNIGIGIKYES